VNENLTEIAFVVDRSGSMVSKVDDAIGGFNSTIEDQKKVEGDARVTVVLFDHEISTIVDAKDINDVPPLNRETYVPRGSTRLRDAIGQTIASVGERLAGEPEEERPGKVIVVVLTDGFENASQEYGVDQLKDMIETQKNEYSWEFVFIGTTEASLDQGRSYGIAICSAHANTGLGTRQGYAGVSRGLTSYRRSGKVDPKDLATE
jgi:uncharacterized protein YegL